MILHKAVNGTILGVAAALLARYPLDVYVAMSAAAGYVYLSTAEKPVWERIAVVCISVLFGWSLAQELARVTWGSETVAVIVVTAFSYIGLDAVQALIKDREFIRSWMKPPKK